MGEQERSDRASVPEQSPGCYLFSFIMVGGHINEVSGNVDPHSQHNPVEGAMADNNAIYSTMVRSGKTTYFVDVREAKNGNKYLSIAESKISGEEKKRSTIRVFGETIDQFRQAINEAASAAEQ